MTSSHMIDSRSAEPDQPLRSGNETPRSAGHAPPSPESGLTRAQALRAASPLIPNAAAVEAAKAAAGAAAPPAGPSTPVAGRSAPTARAPSTALSWQDVFDSGVTPSDSTGAVGPTRYVELVNEKYGVVDCMR